MITRAGTMVQEKECGVTTRLVDAYTVTGPLLRLMPPEAAHRLAIHALRLGIVPSEATADDPSLEVELWGVRFPNPVGLAAGFDKNAEIVDSFPGVGFVEVGTVTPVAQPGNPRPRVFRLPADRGVINRLGFNNDGMDAVAARLARRSGPRIVGVNLGSNRGAADPVRDYVVGLRTLGPHADYIAVNVSSPNTPGLRDLQQPRRLTGLLRALTEVRSEMRLDGSKLPLLVKIAPDLSTTDLDAVARVALEMGVDGIIVSNTTLRRPRTLTSSNRQESGGLSGEPLRDLATTVLRYVARLTTGRLTLIGVGGIANGLDAYARVRAGATLVQLYTALIYHGPGLVQRINADLASALRRDGFASLEGAVGVDV